MMGPGGVSPSDFLNPEEDLEAMDAQPDREEERHEGHPDCQPGGAQGGEPIEKQHVARGERVEAPAIPSVVEDPEDQEGQPTRDEQLPGTTGGPESVARI